MKRFFSRWGLWTAQAALLLGLNACSNDPDPAPRVNTTVVSGQPYVLVLNEGSFPGASELTLVVPRFPSATQDFFAFKNGRALGNGANAIGHYGSKVYVLVTESSTIEVLRASDGQSLARVALVNGTTPRKPREVAFYQGKAYISCYDDNVVVLDTASLAPIAAIPVGPDPEGIAVSGGRIYVANSGGLSFGNEDSTLSVIDPASNTEVARFAVGYNPGALVAADNGDLYVVCRGNYGNIPNRVKVVNGTARQVVKTFPFSAGKLTRKGNTIYAGNYDFTSSASSFWQINTDNRSESALNLDLGGQLFYGLVADPYSDDLLVTTIPGFTASAGTLRVFSRGQSTPRYTLPTGVFPGTAVVIPN